MYSTLAPLGSINPIADLILCSHLNKDVTVSDAVVLDLANWLCNTGPQLDQELR